MTAILKKSKSIVLTAFMLMCGVVFLLPVLLLIMNSFKPYKEILASFTTLPTGLYLGNFQEVIKIMDFGQVFLNTMFITMLTVLGGIAVSYVAAYGISHLQGKMGKRAYMFFIMGQVVPFHTIMIAVSVMITKLNLTNNYYALVAMYIGFHSAFGIFTYVGFLKSVPKGLEEAAALDGCSLLRTMFQVVFPLVFPTTITISVLFFLWTFNDFLLPSILLSDSAMRTITINQYLFRGAASTQWNLFIASLVLSIIPIVLIYIAAQKYITGGLTSGAIK
ncbi:MAG: carbohydrate ABC transporter permease [Ruthenibacterium sp.]